MKRSERGFSLVSAIFLVVVLALLGAAMVTISGSQHMGAANAVLGARAYYAARSGAEWGVDQAINGGNCAGAATPALFGNFTVTVTCVATAHAEAGINYNVYQISSLAETAGVALGSVGYVSRRIQVTATNGP